MQTVQFAEGFAPTHVLATANAWRKGYLASWSRWVLGEVQCGRLALFASISADPHCSISHSTLCRQLNRALLQRQSSHQLFSLAQAARPQWGRFFFFASISVNLFTSISHSTLCWQLNDAPLQWQSAHQFFSRCSLSSASPSHVALAEERRLWNSTNPVVAHCCNALCQKPPAKARVCPFVSGSCVQIRGELQACLRYQSYPEALRK